MSEQTEASPQTEAAEEMSGADGEFGPLNPDGLVATPSTSLRPTPSEALRPAAPPPSELQLEPSQGPGSGDRLYWEERLTALSDDRDDDDLPALPFDGRGTTAQPTGPPVVAAAAPPGRRSVSPYPLYEPPEGTVTDDGSELSGQFSYDDMTPRSVPYPRYRAMSPGGDAAPAGDGEDDGSIPAAPASDRDSQLASEPADAESAGVDSRRSVSAGGAGRGSGRPEKPLLPPDHPLMERFQRALAALLKKQIGKLDLDLVELRKEQRSRTKHRESCGVQLYERQLQLARQQEQQLQLQQRLSEAAEARAAAEQTLAAVRQRHGEIGNRLEADRERERELRADVSALEKNEYHLKSLEADADTELQLRQKMAERAEAEMSQLEQDKQRQDYLIARLSSDADRLRTAIRLNQVQTGAQTEEANLARQVLAEAQLELETLVMERRHLTMTWTNSLNRMQKRDEEYSQLQSDASKLSADLHTIDGEISGYMRSIAQAQEDNEQLMMQRKRLQAERDKFKRAYDHTMSKFDEHKTEYAKFRHILGDTEDKLYQCQTDQRHVERRMKHLQADMERVTDLKRQVEDKILETMQERLTADSAGKYTAKIVHKTREVTKYMEGQVADVENNIARLLLSVSNASTAVSYMNTVLEQLLAEVRLAEENLNRYQQEVHRGNAVIQHKQNKVQELNARLGQLIAAAGGQELGPLEIMIASLHKGIDQLQQQVDGVQQYYIRLQNDLVFSTQERDQLQHVVHTRKKELLIMEQRKLRVERSIETESSSLHAVDLNVKQLRQAVCHLNVRLAGETRLHHQLAANTSVMEYELCHQLRETETECVQVRGQISEKEQRRATLMARMADAGGTELLWEQKIALLKQAKEKLRGETGCAAEVQAMRLEIHRMQVRYGQLLRDQERLMTEMERAVDRRGTIALRAENADRRGRQKAVNFFQRQKKLEDLRRRFKHARRDASHLAGEIQRAERHLENLTSEAVPGRRAAVSGLQQLLERLREGLQHRSALRGQNLGRIVLKQQSSRYYQSVLDGTYSPHLRSRTKLQLELEGVDEKHNSVRLLVLQLLRDRPQLQERLAFVRDLLKL
ncbi:Coiled-coil domain-containing protein 40 [Amphibalanus amphitrite]|uniref:Coiled-coil domain-containing protein 40 n=1 Tax=Amphibalanus amphitrite TaxID=1232801 RepID=A0A6A4WJL2_AMPAM|nr:Coiled-coil domain-containing protein 40 [Amphibalanus amphitrite]